MNLLQSEVKHKIHIPNSDIILSKLMRNYRNQTVHLTWGSEKYFGFSILNLLVEYPKEQITICLF